MGNYASKVIEVALGEVGYLEKKSNKNLDDKTANAGYNNYNKYAKMLDNLGYFYNGKKNGYAWCDCFTDAVFVMAYGVDEALKLLCQPKRSYGAGVRYSANYYKKNKQFYKKNPKPGDQIFFYKSNRVQLAHTGLVVKVDDTYVYTVEGNTSRAKGVVPNGGGVHEKKYKLTYKLIYGYGRPKYDPEPGGGTGASSSTSEPVKTPTSTTTTKKSVTEIAKEVIAGKWGSGTTRKSKLKKAGYNYSEVQKKVNEILKSKKTTSPKKSVTEIAKEVIAGKWGNGATRKSKLKKAGYDPAEVQKKVNELL